jgi:hypothetical protein
VGTLEDPSVFPPKCEFHGVEREEWVGEVEGCKQLGKM